MGKKVSSLVLVAELLVRKMFVSLWNQNFHRTSQTNLGILKTNNVEENRIPQPGRYLRFPFCKFVTILNTFFNVITLRGLLTSSRNKFGV